MNNKAFRESKKATEKMFNQEKIECALRNKEFCFLAGKDVRIRGIY